VPKILVVDDEEPLRASLSYTLGREGYAVSTAADGLTAVELARRGDPDVILLDLMLPGIDGLEVCRQIRAFSDVPIVMLTAKDQSSDKVLGLDGGADDYVTKPFHTRELVARLAAVMRRRASAQRLVDEDRALVGRLQDMIRDLPPVRAGDSQGILEGGAVRMDLGRGTVTVDGQPVELSPPEHELLRLLLSSKGRVVTRTELLSRVWGDAPPGGLTLLDVVVRSLRDKIEPVPARPRFLITVPGIGFLFSDAR
jgi:two-component system, OmpR family, response regulator RegX3